jgi:DNA-binding MarR family transcriptional regulator
MLNLYMKTMASLITVMKTIKLKPQQLAVLARQRLAVHLEKRLLVMISQTPGSSVYDLSKKTKRDPSTVHSAVKRLSTRQLVTTRTILRKEGKVKRVYPANFQFDDFREIMLPKEVVHIGNPTWQQAYIYKLNAESIGIAGEPVLDWEERAKPIIQKAEHAEDGSIRVRLPDEVCNFYNLDKKEKLLAYINNKALLTITGSFE